MVTRGGKAVRSTARSREVELKFGCFSLVVVKYSLGQRPIPIQIGQDEGGRKSIN